VKECRIGIFLHNLQIINQHSRPKISVQQIWEIISTNSRYRRSINLGMGLIQQCSMQMSPK
jgi:hypothetical protein